MRVQAAGGPPEQSLRRARGAAMARRVALLALLATACRDAPVPFVSADRPALEADTSGVRLTFSVHDQQSPAWSAGGDSVYYATVLPGAEVQTAWTLAAVPANGGVAVPLRSGVLDLGGAAPALAPDGATLAIAMPFVSLVNAPCVHVSSSCTAVSRPIPRVRGVRYALHGLGGQTLPADSAVRFDNAVLRGDEVSSSTFHVTIDPVERVFSEEGRMPFRASWSPDGRQLVVSSGLMLLTWTPATRGLVVIAGSDEGVYPAWSPDGQWIAYTALNRGALRQWTCQYYFAERVPACFAFWREWTGRGGVTVIMRPDGSGRIELGEGMAPAWSPDARSLYVERDGRIWRIGLDGTSEPVAGTAGAREPAVSPDGSRLAFVRRAAASTDLDVWVLPLDSQP